MNKRLQDAVSKAETTLNEAEKNCLAELIEDYISQEGSVDLEDHLTPEQIADLNERLTRDFEYADMDEVRALFRKHGLNPRF